MMDTRHGTVGFTGLALITAGILVEAIRVPDTLQVLTSVLGGVLAGLGAYHPLLAPETDEFFEDDAVDD